MFLVGSMPLENVDPPRGDFGPKFGKTFFSFSAGRNSTLESSSCILWRWPWPPKCRSIRN